MALAGCGDVIVTPIGAKGGNAGEGGVGSDASLTPDAPGGSDAGRADAGGGGDDAGPMFDASAFCQGHGPIEIAPQLCTGDLAHKFRFAACACASLSVSGQLATDAFDSTGDAGADANALSASIAANESVSTNTHTMLGGSVWAGGLGAGGMPAVALHGDGTVARDVQVGGSLDVGGAFQVGGDVFASGDITVEDVDGGNSLSVSGAVHVPDGGVVSSGVVAAGGIVSQAVRVAPPCDCSSSNLIDVFAIVAAGKTNNDNATLGMATNALDNPPSPVQLPCGRYYLDGIQGGAVYLDIQGRVALFVDGQVSVDGGLRITLAPNAELDLFIAGDVAILDTTMIGNVNAPARVRVYVGGSMVTLTGSNNVGANIYAPAATVSLASDFEMWGAFLAGEFIFSGNFTIHYDTSVLGASGCTPPGGRCNTCNDCSGSTPACIGGTCAACRSNADCCAPLVCNGGLCEQPTL
jgi:hypothetical protein